MNYVEPMIRVRFLHKNILFVFDMADDVESENKSDNTDMTPGLPFYNDGIVEPTKNRYPYCIVWTPIPLLT